MKNIIKTLIVMLTSISLFSTANAGELGVSGTAKATYNIQSGKSTMGKGLGITNELNFTAAGELDNGYTWSYSMELDPGATTAAGTTDNSPQNAQNDDTKLTMTMPYGTVGVFISEGGLDLEDGASQSVYSRPTDLGDPSATADNYTIDAYNNVQYHTPADLMPLGLTAKIAYAPDLHSYGSGNNKNGTVTEGGVGFAGRSAMEMQVKAAPIDGLTVGASYMDFDKQGVGTNKKNQEAESGAYMAEYAMGNISVGYSKAYRANLISDNNANSETVEYYDQSNMSIAYVVNDDLSVSYEQEKSNANMIDDATADVEQKSTSYQLAYNMGGMTIALVRSGHDNNGYVTAANTDQTVLAVTMAF